MDAEVKKKWADALRSGTYKQGKYQFVNEGPEKTYCCLGVFCEVQNLFGTDDSDGSQITPDAAAFFSKTLEKLGFAAGQQTELIEMNDKQEKSFVEIADWVEKNL